MHGSSSPRQDAPDRGHSSLLSEGLRVITRIGARRPRTTLWFVVMSACVAAAFTFLCLEFKTDRADLIDPSAEFHQRWMNYTEQFGETNDIVVVVEGEDPEAIKGALEELGSRIVREPDLFQNVLYKISAGALRSKGLQFLNPAQLEVGLRHIAEYGPILRGRWDLIRLESLIPRLQYQIDSRRNVNRQPGERAPDITPLLTHADLLSVSLAGFLENPRDFHNPWPVLLPVDRLLGDPREDVTYLMNETKTMGFVNLRPATKAKNFKGDSKPIARLRELIAEAQHDHPTVKIGMTGVPVLEADEMRRSQTDMLLSTSVSVIGVTLLLFLGLRGFRHALLGLLMLLVGMAWAFGFTTLAVGHLNILSVSFAAMLVGLGIDFAVVYTSRYLELRHEGRPLRTALLEATDGVGTGIVTAAVTTALAFFCATFTDFRGVAELGVIAGGGILLCALAAFVVLPPAVALADRNIELRRLPSPFEGRLLRKITSGYPLPVVVVMVALIGFVGAQMVRVEDGQLVSRVRYDYNLLNLQADGVESVDLEKRVFEQSGGSLLFAVSIADSQQEARALRKKFEALPSVHHVEDLASRLPNWPARDTRLLIQAYQAQLAQLPERPLVSPATDPAAVGQVIENFYVRVRELKHPLAQKVAKTIDAFLDRFEALTLKQQMEFLTRYQYAMSAALLGQFQALRASSNPEPIVFDDIPPELRSRFISPDGKWLLQIYPNDHVWDEEPLRRFVSDVRSVDPEATGIPLQNFEASGQIKDSYKTAAMYAFAMICVVLLVDFMKREYKLLTLIAPLVVVGAVAALLTSRRTEFNHVHLITAYVLMAVAIAAVLDPRNLRDALFAMLPPVGGTVLMFGCLGLLGIDLNPANLIVLPLVLGTGVDFGIHVVHNFREKQGGPYRMASSTMNSIVLTSTTSIVGFGSLMLAAHRGLFSVGLVYSIGLMSCLVISLVMLPALLTLVSGAASAAEAQSAPPPGDPRRSDKSGKVRAA